MAKYGLSLCLLLLAGCATFQGWSRQRSLESTLDTYRKAICWGDYQVVESLTKMQGTDPQSQNLKKLEKIKVTSYRVVESNTSEDKLRAHQTVEIKYFNTDHLIVKALIYKEVWEYDTEQETWYLQSALPDFK